MNQEPTCTFTTSESLTDFAPAFSLAQSEMANALKNAQNPHLKNRYADLGAVQAAVMPPLNANGFSVIQAPNGPGTVTTRILHKSGQWIQTVSSSPLSKQDHQAVGSGITYLRRYSLAGLCGITQEDDDGESAIREVKPKAAAKEIYDLPTTVANIGTAPEAEAKAIAREAIARYEFTGDKASEKVIREAARKRFPAEAKK